jgi:RNA polymerase sigma factor (sigma-70 family)
MDPQQISSLIQRAREGDASAWDLIVDEFTSLVWSVVRGFRLQDASSADAVQATWVALLQHLDEIREPARLPGWMCTTARRACLAILRDSGRELPADYVETPWSASARRGDEPAASEPETDVVRREQVALLRAAIASLPAPQRALIELLTASPPLSYQEVSDRLGMPIGSIGPTRARILERLRRQLESAGLHDAIPA